MKSWSLIHKRRITADSNCHCYTGNIASSLGKFMHSQLRYSPIANKSTLRWKMANANAQWTAGSHVIARLGFYLQTKEARVAGRTVSCLPGCLFGWRLGLHLHFRTGISFDGRGSDWLKCSLRLCEAASGNAILSIVRRICRQTADRLQRETVRSTDRN